MVKSKISINGVKFCLIVFLQLTLLITGVSPSTAKTIELKSVCFLPVSTNESKTYLKLVDRINEKAKGKLVIKNLGGPEVMPAVEQTDAIREGMFDIGMVAPDFYSRIIPEAQIFYYTTDSHMDQRKSGFFDIMVKLHKKLNYRYLCRTSGSDPFYVFVNKKLANPREGFKGMKIRSVEPYAVFLDALGCARVTVPRVDVYGALERGVIDGFLSPSSLVRVTTQYEVTKYIITPAVFQSNVIVIMNNEKFESLSKDIQDLILKETEVFEKVAWDIMKKEAEESFNFLVTEGKMQEIKFEGEDAEWFLDKANRLPVEETLKKSPEYGPKLLKAMGLSY